MGSLGITPKLFSAFLDFNEKISIKGNIPGVIAKV